MIRENILKKLHETEIHYNVKIPFAIESGSRSWGFPSPDSDYDCRFIYLHEKNYYLSVLEKKDYIQYASDEIYDINGWDLKKAIQHILKSNATVFEWLSSNDIYICDNYFREQMQNLANLFFNPVAISYHYLNIAKNKLNEIIAEDESKLKKYFYILRPIANLNFIYIHKKMPYMEYDITLKEAMPDAEIFDIIQELKSLKSVSDESFLINRHDKLIDYFTKEIELFENQLKDMKFTKNRNYEPADEVFRNLIEKMWQND